MCGLVGVAGTLALQDKNAFDDLLVIDAIRGKDATGVASVKQGEPHSTYLVKGPGGPEMLQDRVSYAKTVNTDRMLLLGHNRFRTMGDASAKNAHPFEFSNIVGAHNGTVRGKHVFKDGYLFDTDSEALLNNINELGLEDTVSKIDGAYALVWWDKRKHSLNMLRNWERPLYYVIDDAGSAIFWASEIAMLYLALNHNNIKFQGKKVYSLPEDQHFEWVIPLKRNIAIPAQTRTKIKAPTRPLASKTQTHATGHGCGVPGVQNNNLRKFPVVVNNAASGTSSMTPFPSRDTTNMMKPGDRVVWDDKVHDFVVVHADGKPAEPTVPLNLNRMLVDSKNVPYYIGAKAQIINELEFNAIADKGCANCGGQPSFSEPVKFLQDGGLVCVDCMLSNHEGLADLVKMM